jgi:hypothetical protein
VTEPAWSDDSLAILRARLAAPVTRQPPRPSRARDRDRLAQRVVPVAAELACIVHGDGDAGAVQEFLDRLSRPEERALLVVLAAMVPVDQPMDDLLGWVSWAPPSRKPPEGANERRQEERARRMAELRRHLDAQVPLREAAVLVGVKAGTAREYRAAIEQQREESEAAA